MSRQYDAHGMRTDLGHDQCTADMMDRCNNARCSVHGYALHTFAAWETEVARLGKHYDPSVDTAVKDALGLAGEVGEVVELIKKDRFQSQPLDRAELCLELGDVLWYLTNMAAGFGLTLENVANANRDKLRKRYPDGFKPGGGVR